MSLLLLSLCPVLLVPLGCSFLGFLRLTVGDWGEPRPCLALYGNHMAHSGVLPGDIALASENTSLSLCSRYLWMTLVSCCCPFVGGLTLMASQLILQLSKQFPELKLLGFKHWSHFCFVVWYVVHILVSSSLPAAQNLLTSPSLFWFVFLVS